MVAAGLQPYVPATRAGALLANLFVLTSESSPPLLTDDEVVAQVDTLTLTLTLALTLTLTLALTLTLTLTLALTLTLNDF